jgi:protocatechuate 3,4-dioxygenase beta subunit
VVRDPARNLAAAEFVTEETTNVTIQLQPALTLTGRVEGIDGSPLPEAEVGVWLLACRTYNQLDEQLDITDASGVFNIRTVPTG